MPQEVEQYVMPKLKPEAEVQVKDYIERIKLIQEKARENNQKAQEKSKKSFDKTAQETNFRPGDLVLLKVKARRKGRTPKLEDKYFGPFEVLAQVSEVNYRIRKKDSNKEMTVHVNRMKTLPEEQVKKTNSWQNCLENSIMCLRDLRMTSCQNTARRMKKRSETRKMKNESLNTDMRKGNYNS